MGAMVMEDTSGRSAAALIGLLARSVQKIVPQSGDHLTVLPELTLHRRNKPSQAVHCIYTLGLALTLQGSKHVLIGEREINYGPGQSLLTAIDLPVSYHITRATAMEPYLGIMLKFDRSQISELGSTLNLRQVSRRTGVEPVSVERLDAPTLDAIYRLVSLMEEPPLLPLLAPLIQREILARLLTGPHASHLAHFVLDTANPTQQISDAVTWIRQHFAEDMHVEQLARNSSMSPTTFRQHFRAITGTSPVQFQKFLRLQEARQLMLDQNMSAGSASALVGYESPSQFNREYRRLFGVPPQRDIRKMQPH